MTCQLPATGGGSAGTIVIGLLLVASGVGVLLAVRRPGARAVLPVVVLLAAAVGVAADRPAAAATDCPATTVLAPTPSSSAPSTTVAPTSTTIAPTTTTTTTLLATTSSAPPTTIGAVTFCSALTPNDSGGFMVDVLIVLSGGAGTFSARARHRLGPVTARW
jgi:LPXTG-motif cell wall-anchored protein